MKQTCKFTNTRGSTDTGAPNHLPDTHVCGSRIQLVSGAGPTWHQSSRPPQLSLRKWALASCFHTHTASSETISCMCTLLFLRSGLCSCLLIHTLKPHSLPSMSWLYTRITGEGRVEEVRAAFRETFRQTLSKMLASGYESQQTPQPILLLFPEDEKPRPKAGGYGLHVGPLREP